MGVAGAKPPYRSSAICATASCSGFVRLTASILAWTRGGSPTFSPGTDAGRVCPRALQDAKPTKHTQPFTGERGLGIGIINQKFISKTDFFYKLKYGCFTRQPYFLHLVNPHKHSLYLTFQKLFKIFLKFLKLFRPCRRLPKCKQLIKRYSKKLLNF